jgi:hypothetical protein
MCGRYDNLIPREAYAGLFKATRVSRSNFPPRYNASVLPGALGLPILPDVSAFGT